jgi:hypothetical protein
MEELDPITEESFMRLQFNIGKKSFHPLHLYTVSRKGLFRLGSEKRETEEK